MFPLEREELRPGVADIKVFKPVATNSGDRIRIFETNDGKATITAMSPANQDTVIVTNVDGGIETAEINWGGLWDKAKKIAEGAKDVIDTILDGDGGGGGGGGGGNQKCTSTTEIDVGPNGRVRRIRTTTSCGPA